MTNAQKILNNLYLVGSSSISGSGDCMIYALGVGTEPNKAICLIDAGTRYAEEIITNIQETDLANLSLKYMILTHCHFDHIGAAYQFQEIYPKLEIYAHKLDLNAIHGGKGSQQLTAAGWYGAQLKPPHVEHVITYSHEKINLDGTILECYHTPGHTPGSIVVLVEIEGKKVLFGQDIHGPFMQEFNSNLKDYEKSMKLLLGLEADILCEGHYGIFEGKEKVKNFIESQMQENL
jgi:glyoxylase-like metal-dependent hydrolase (beta-lactamase superfamily II)